MRFSNYRFSTPCLGLLFALVLTNSITAEAQLSQLYFDEPAAKDSAKEVAGEPAKVESQKVSKVITGPSSKKSTAKLIINDVASARAHMNSAKIRTKKYISKVVRIFLMPTLGGPETDSENDSEITSHISWTAKEDCSKPVDLENRNKKSMAIEELIRKFTGENELAAKHCGYRCSPGKTPILSSLEMGDMKGGSLLAIERDSACHFRMTKPADRYWPMYEVLKITCRCMAPNS